VNGSVNSGELQKKAVMYQPDRTILEGYLTWQEVQLLVMRFAPRNVGKTQFYQWLELLEEVASEPYSNYVAAQMIQFGALLNRSRQYGGTLEVAKTDLNRYLNSFDTKDQFVQEVFHEAQNRYRPQLVWVYPEAIQGKTIEVVGRPV
jgi:hypothetical protein